MLTVVIPTSGRSTLLERTLRSLTKCDQPPGYQSTLVVENGERAGAEAVVAACPSVLRARYVHHPIANKSDALNTALHHVDDGLIVFLDDDVRVARNTLQSYYDVSRAGERGEFFGGPIGVDYEVEPPDWLKRYLPVSARGWHLDTQQVVDVERPSFLGCNWAAYLSDLRRIGGFDANFGPGSRTSATGQETNAQMRLLTAGIRARYVPAAWVWHYVPETRCTPDWTIQRVYRNGFGDARAIRGTPRAAALVPLAWIRWQLAKLHARCLPAGPESWRFAARWYRSKWCGIMDGFRESEDR